MNNDYRKAKREKFLSIAVIFLFTCFITRLIQVQLFEHSQWAKIAKKQSHKTIEVKPIRGEILDRNGMTMARTVPLTYSIGFRPAEGQNLDELASTLSAHLSLQKQAIRKSLTTQKFTYIAKKVNFETAQKIQALNLKCLQFDEEPRRSYPGLTHASALLGYVNSQGIGMEGIEASMNKELTGETFKEVCWLDATRSNPAMISEKNPDDFYGSNVTLTIDLQLQNIVENELREGLKNQVYERACAVLTQPQTGEILAVATIPNFDPNKPGDVNPIHRKCWPITEVYEPGSVMKVIPFALALESNKFRRNSSVYCENGSYQIKGAVLHDSHPHGSLTLDGILAQSSNIGTAKIAANFSPQEIYERIRAFGFGNLTSVGLLNEQPGYLPHPTTWSGPTQANLAIGHGISCTALQVAMAYGSIANGGYLMKPLLIKSVEKPDGKIEENNSEVIRKVMSPQVAKQLTDMLVGVVESGTGETAKMPGIRVAGKTGTAQKVDHEHKTYFQKRFVSSFAGYLPADDPEYLLMIVVDDPRGKYFGATVAAPVFKSIMDEILSIRPLENSNTDLTRTHETNGGTQLLTILAR